MHAWAKARGLIPLPPGLSCLSTTVKQVLIKDHPYILYPETTCV